MEGHSNQSVCLDTLINNIPPIWSPLTFKLLEGTPKFTCEAAIATSCFVCVGVYVSASITALFIFRRLHKQKKNYSFLLVSMVIGDALSSFFLAHFAAWRLVLDSLQSNLSCLNPSRIYFYRAVFDVPAFAMQLTGSMLLLSCCLDRIQAMAWPMNYHVIDRRKRCIRINLISYSIGWIYSVLAQSLTMNTERLARRNPDQFLLPLPNSTRDIVNAARSDVLQTCSTDAYFHARFWYANDFRVLTCQVHWGLFKDPHLPRSIPLPDLMDVKLGLDVCLAVATAVLIKVYAGRHNKVVGLGSNAMEARKKHETAVCRALIIEVSKLHKLASKLHKSNHSRSIVSGYLSGSGCPNWRALRSAHGTHHIRNC